jgi:hypothetical protein
VHINGAPTPLMFFGMIGKLKNNEKRTLCQL